MKVLEFETSKGRFCVTDGYDCINGGIEIRNITEEQSREIVKQSIHTNLYAHYVENIEVNTYCYISAIESLHSLLKSKGIHLFENPVPTPEYQCDNFGNGGMCESWINTYKTEEEKTFYNPFIFKL